MLDVNHPLVITLKDTLYKHGLPGKVDAMVAACDAWQYANIAGIPKVVFGKGRSSVCHSEKEHMDIDEMMKAASVLVEFFIAYQ